MTLSEARETIRTASRGEQGTITFGVHLDSTEEAIDRCVDEIGEEEFGAFLDFFEGFVDDCLEEFDYTIIDPEQSAAAIGEYSIQSGKSFLEEEVGLNNETGCFALFVADGGEPGRGAGDFFAIAFLDADEGNWYVNCGIVGGGNIKVEDGGF